MTDLTKIDRPFGELDRETKGALLLAALEGAEIEFFDPEDDGPILSSTWPLRWHEGMVYRVKPAPLTKDTINWTQVAEGWEWMARDENGRAYFFLSKPEQRGHVWTDLKGTAVRVTQSSYVRGTCDWKDSLLIRPGKE